MDSCPHLSWEHAGPDNTRHCCCNNLQIEVERNCCWNKCSRIDDRCGLPDGATWKKYISTPHDAYHVVSVTGTFVLYRCIILMIYSLALTSC